jgi:hypothetical protein
MVLPAAALLVSERWELAVELTKAGKLPEVKLRE